MPRGDVIAGRFLLHSEIAKGGMGTVFRALDQDTNRTVAVKLLRSSEVSSTGRFQRESALLAILDHPNIVKYVDHGVEPGGVHYLVMEWVDGETLLERMTHGLTAAETVAMATRVADALAHAHHRGVVHRDIKPSNLIFPGGTVEEDVKLLDFGIARLAMGDKNLTATGVMVGTIGYMSPEQARASRDATLDARADVFALGCVLYECLTGHAPFGGNNIMAVRAKVLLVEPAPIRTVAGDVPAPLADLVARMMAKDPSRRPADGAALAGELRALGPIAETERRPFTGGGAERATHTDADERPTDPVDCVLLVSPYLDDASDDVTITREYEADLERRERVLAKVVAIYGGKLLQLSDGSLIVTMAGDGTLDERVERAARCALAVRDQLAAGSIAVTVEPEKKITHVLDKLIDRGAKVLDQATITTSFAELLRGGSAATIWLDPHSARILGERFQIQQGQAGFQLVGER